MKWRKIKYILFHRSVLAGLALLLTLSLAVTFSDVGKLFGV